MEPKYRTSTKAALGGGVAVIVMWLVGYFFPEFAAAAPPGAETGIGVIVTAIVARLSRTAARPGAL